jgi:hypothetical protein
LEAGAVVSNSIIAWCERHDEKQTAQIILRWVDHDKLKESINFERGLDPKDAMGIGSKNWWKNINRKLFVVKKDFTLDKDYVIRDINDERGNLMFHKGTGIELIKAYPTNDYIIYHCYLEDLKNGNRAYNITGSYDDFEEYFKPIKELKESYNNFKRGIDPKKAMSIGYGEIIKNFMKDFFESDKEKLIFSIQFISLKNDNIGLEINCNDMLMPNKIKELHWEENTIINQTNYINNILSNFGFIKIYEPKVSDISRKYHYALTFTYKIPEEYNEIIEKYYNLDMLFWRKEVMF